MSITYEGKTANFSSVIYEDDIVSFRDFLQRNASDEVTFDFEKCEDIHLGVLQLVMAYKKNYKCVYKFSDNDALYSKVLKGFNTSENYCN
ncbi:MAG: hypothetical protein COB17_03290 [Sulfurimonas sp.]|nr:MAG: hypothetical protein COB17_03290 [Sulfurimonas sp.]